MAARIRGRNWVFTINNFSEEEKNRLITISERDDVLRMIAETEHTGEGEGTPHIQGYISFVNPFYRDCVELMIGGRAFIEPAKGGWKQNFTYCSKENTVFIRKGDNPVATERLSSIVTEDALEAMKKMSAREFQDAYPSIWFWHRQKVLETMLDWSLRRVQKWTGELPSKNYWIWGPAGVGKSQWATSIASVGETYKKNCNKWWDGFSFIEHTCVVIEDYPCAPAGAVLTQFVKVWGDRYPFIGEVKGGSMQIQPGRFNLIITSNYSMEACFTFADDIEAIKRRFTEIHILAQNDLALQMRPNRDLLDH